MRKTTLKSASQTMIVVLICVAALFALMRLNRVYRPETGRSQGFELFIGKGCIHCHFTESTETKIGPGLKGLFERKTLPASGREATGENVRQQLTTPYRAMPSFADRLTEEEKSRLIDYLKTL